MDKTIIEAVDELLKCPERLAARLRNADIFFGLYKYTNAHWPTEAQWRYNITAYWWGGEKPEIEEHLFPHMDAVHRYLLTGVADKEAHNG